MTPREPVIPDKLYFKIGEVSRITGVKPYVLRYWESEFKLLAPSKSRSKQRLYRRKDIENVLEIKKLLYKERFTIAGAKKMLKTDPMKEAAAQLELGNDSGAYQVALQRVQAELLELKNSLK
ncbi:MAG: MerR family transcriptional regulator [Myxococcota bacterium]